LDILLLSGTFITQAAINPYRFIHHDVIGAAVFAFLLGIYLSLGPLYFIYLLHHYCFPNNAVNNENALEQMKQFFSRLFPFGKGLVHDYWAGNIWAIYIFVFKCLLFLALQRFLPLLPFHNAFKKGLPDMTPAISAVLSLISVAPALICAYKVAAISLEKPLKTALFFLHAIVSG
jgi:alpha-1,3-glucosyltransferase